MLSKNRKVLSILSILIIMVAFFAQSVAPAAALFGSTRLHDPSVIRVGTCYYGFSTSFNGVNGTTGPSGPWIYKTCDPTLVTGWTYIGAVFNTVPAWIVTKLGGQTPPNLWAPDINFWNGTYYLYYAGAIWGSGPAPVIGLATATDIEGPWTDAGQVVGPTDIDPNMIVVEWNQISAVGWL